MKSKIQAELAKATEVLPDGAELITNEHYMLALMKAISKLSEKDWDALSVPAQDWFNEAADAKAAKKTIPPFPDLEREPEPEPEATPRRRKSADAEPEKAAQRDVKKGDVVTVTTKRGATIKGAVTNPDDDGELVIDEGKDGEVGVKLTNIEKIEFAPEKPAEPEATTRRRKPADDEPPVSSEPEVGDTVQLETARGSIKMGNLVEITDKIVVIKDAAGEELEFDKDRVKSLTVKVKNAKAGTTKAPAKTAEPDTKGGRRADDKEDPKDSKAGSGKATLRAREIILDDLTLTKEGVVKALKKEFPDAKENTVGLIYTEVHKIVGMLKDRKMMK